MAKKTYETPVADLLRFDYKDNVTASRNGGNSNKCLGKQWHSCGGQQQPGPCYQDAGILEASECM